MGRLKTAAELWKSGRGLSPGVANLQARREQLLHDQLSLA